MSYSQPTCKCLEFDLLKTELVSNFPLHTWKNKIRITTLKHCVMLGPVNTCTLWLFVHSKAIENAHCFRMQLKLIVLKSSHKFLEKKKISQNIILFSQAQGMSQITLLEQKR